MAYLSNYSANSQYVVKAFSALFGAGVTGDLIASGDTILTASTSKTALINVLLNNSVVLNSFPLYGANVTNDAFAGALIDNMTKGSGVDAATIAGWKTAVAAAIPSYASRAEAVTALIDSVTNYSGSDANLALVKAVVNNRAEVGAFKAQNGASTFSTLSSLQTQVASVDTTAASVTAAQTATNEAATSYVLTTAQDLFTGTNADNVFRAVAGNANGTQDQTTLNSSDIIDGGVGADTLIVNMTGANYNGGARIKNIETLQIGTNQAAATFDYNVNAGSNEVTEVKTIVADQINTGEALTINNLVRDNATAAIPAMSWVNDNTGANGLAGTVNLNYRAATVSGTADEQALSLTNVRAGTLNLATGIEKVTLTSAGTATNSIDKVQSGTTLTDVVIKAAAQLGGNRVVSTADATKGLEINRTATNANTEHNSFVNMGASVKNVTAEGSAAGVNIAFTDTTAVDNTFVGGDGADSVIVNGGNDKLSGGKGADTFIFGQTNTSANGTFFNNSDTIDGGEGTDTIQFDYGNGAVTIQTSEWLNSKGVDAIDLRGQNNRVQLDDAFVGRADATSFEVITNKIVQNDAANSVSDEVSSRHQIDLSTVGANRAVKVTGGEGRETVIVTDALNGMQTLSGGNGLDVLVVKNGATLTGQDLQNVSGFNVMNLVKTSGNAQVFNIDLSASFLTKAIDANAAAGTSVNTANLFRIVTDGADASGNGNSLSGVQEIGTGDTINLTIDTAGLTAGSGAINVNDLLATNAAVRIRNAAGQDLVTKAAGANQPITVAATAGNIFTAANATATADATYTTTGAASVGTLTTSGQASTGGGGVAPVAGNTFTLTAANAILTTTVSANVTPASTYLSSGADTIAANANLSGALVTDATTGDGDVLTAIVAGAITNPTIQNIETINLTANNGSFSLAGVTGATAINVSGGAMTFTNADSKPINLASGYAGALVANVTGATTQGVTIGLAGTAAGTTVSTDSDLATATGAALTLNLTANSTVTTATVDSASNAANGVNRIDVTGTGTLTLGTVTDTGGDGTIEVRATALNGGLVHTAAGATTTVVGGTGADTISTALTTININTANGDDTVNYTGGAAVANTVILNGGAGTDTLNVASAHANWNARAQVANITNFETINFTGTAAASFQTNDANVAFGQTLNVNASGIVLATAATAGFTFDGSAETNGRFNITGTNGVDTITATGANGDTINLSQGGNDIVKLATGSSGVVTTGFTSFSTANLDVITGLTAGDALNLQATYAAVGGAGATSAVTAVATNATLADNQANLVRGTYDAVAGTFTVSGTGNDSVFVYDANAATGAGNQSYQAVVLVGVVQAAPGALAVVGGEVAYTFI